jgi:hypothetical protein
MLVSLIIWVMTGIIYNILNAAATCINYVLVCFIVSLSLSIIAGIMISRQLLRYFSASNKFIFGLANILLLYTSANGMQAAYCVVSSPADNEVKCASLLPFIQARPWLPDVFHINEIQELRTQNERLRNNQSVTAPTPDNNAALYGQIEQLKEANRKLQEQYEQSLQAAPATTVPLVDVSSLYSQIDVLQQRLIAFNRLQADWVNTTGSKYDSDVRGMIDRIMQREYFTQLFYTPLDTSLFISRQGQ